MADRLSCLLVKLSAQEPPNTSPEVQRLYSRASCLGFGFTLCLDVRLRCKSLLTGLALAFLEVMMCGRKQPRSIFSLQSSFLAEMSCLRRQSYKKGASAHSLDIAIV